MNFLRHRKFRLNMRRTSSLWGWRSTGTGCPGRFWSLLLWRYSRPAWTRSCAACCRWPCFVRGFGLDDPQRSLPTPNILWFCDLPFPSSRRGEDSPSRAQGPGYHLRKTRQEVAVGWAKTLPQITPTTPNRSLTPSEWATSNFKQMRNVSPPLKYHFWFNKKVTIKN